MKVGIALPLSAKDGDGGTWAGIAGLATRADAGGADSLWAFDHYLFRNPGKPDQGSHEPFTVLAAAAAVTRTVALGPLVASTSFRGPGMLAKIAAALDLVAPGRVVLGVGCGWQEAEYTAFGHPFDHRVSRFEETLSIVRPLLDGERVTFSGAYQQAEDAVLLPEPAHRVPLLIAADGPRMLGLVSRWADAWQTAWFGAPDAKFREERARMEAACAAAGRATPPEVYVGVQVKLAGADGRGLVLDSSAIADGLAAWREEGVAHVQLWLQPATAATLELALVGLHRFRG